MKKILSVALLSCCLLVPAQAQDAPSINITRNSSLSPNPGSANFFSGSVQVCPLFPAHSPSRMSGGRVTFQPGARSAWHTHPFGQVLIIVSGAGWIQQWGGPIQEMRQGDVVWIPPGVKHWHGATANSAVTHLALQEELNGQAVVWLEKVSDEQYLNKEGNPNTMTSALEKYRQGPLAELWKRPDLSLRDRSVVTLAALISRNQTVELTHYLNVALDNGVKPREISEIITHLAFYSGWANAVSATALADEVFAARHISPDRLAPASLSLLPLNEEAESKRAAAVEQQFGNVAPGVVHYTTEVLFRDLWLRPDLAPRDRSLVTVAALIANGQVAQIPYHLNRAMDNGLTQAQAAETVTHLAFYVGWPNVFSALPTVKDVFEKRPH